MSQHGGVREGAGRKPLGGPGGSHRVIVQVRENQTPAQMSLSTLPEQREFLRRLGDGNVSAGFRKLFAVIEILKDNVGLLERIEDFVRIEGSQDHVTQFRKIIDHIRNVTLQ